MAKDRVENAQKNQNWLNNDQYMAKNCQTNGQTWSTMVQEWSKNNQNVAETWPKHCQTWSIYGQTCKKLSTVVKTWSNKMVKNGRKVLNVSSNGQQVPNNVKHGQKWF